MKLVKDGNIVTEDNLNCVNIWLRLGYVEYVEEVKPTRKSK